MGDGEGIYKTIRYANDLYHHPSGGGPGFGERYDLGRFTPGEDAQDSTPKYAEYPAEYNATVVGEAVLGVSPMSGERLRSIRVFPPVGTRLGLVSRTPAC